jgi:hypothetical protein
MKLSPTGNVENMIERTMMIDTISKVDNVSSASSSTSMSLFSESRIRSTFCSSSLFFAGSSESEDFDWM